MWKANHDDDGALCEWPLPRVLPECLPACRGRLYRYDPTTGLAVRPMSGWAIVTSACQGCSQIFSYNPHKVPSIRVEGVRQPICRNCIERASVIRVANGLDPIELHPEAYEPIREEEL